MNGDNTNDHVRVDGEVEQLQVSIVDHQAGVLHALFVSKPEGDEEITRSDDDDADPAKHFEGVLIDVVSTGVDLRGGVVGLTVVQG